MTPDQIIEAVCDVTGVGPQGLRSAARSYAFARPRQLSYFLLHDLLAMGPSEIGRVLGRDHTTITHGLRKAGELLEQNTAFREMHEKAIERIAGAKAEQGESRG